MRQQQKRHEEVPHVLEIYIIEVSSQLFDFFIHAAKNTGYLLNNRLEHPTENLAVMTVNNMSEIMCTMQNY